jgi:hypothetical protein
MAKSYRGVDDYGLGLTWTVVRRGSIVVKGAEAVAYAEKNREPLYVLGDLREPDWQADFARAHQLSHCEPGQGTGSRTGQGRGQCFSLSRRG